MRVHSLFVHILLVISFILVVSCAHHRSNYESKAILAYMAQMRSVSFFEQDQAWLVHEQRRDLRVTTDGGQTWRVFPANSIVDGFECATFSSPNRAWAVSHNGRVFTTNYPPGAWTQISDLKATTSGDFSGAKQIEFVDETTGWILEALSIWHTKDGGVTWTKTLSVLTPGVNGQPTSMYAIDGATLVATGGKGQIYLTRDGGVTWKVQTLETKPDLKDVWFSDKQAGWICGYTSGRDSILMVLFATKDGGESWNELPLVDRNMMPSSVCFVENEGWIAGHRYLDNKSPAHLEAVLLHTTDGGLHWTLMPFPSDDPFFSLVRFSDKSNGWLVGRDNLYRTQDGGKTWRRVLAWPPVG